jgi:hypothetical protein
MNGRLRFGPLAFFVFNGLSPGQSTSDDEQIYVFVATNARATTARYAKHTGAYASLSTRQQHTRTDTHARMHALIQTPTHTHACTLSYKHL